MCVRFIALRTDVIAPPSTLSVTRERLCDFVPENVK